MKSYSLTDKLPDRLPMTPPDDPPEPDLSGALPCPKCGYEPIGQIRADGQRRVRCDQNHLIGSWEDTGDKAIEYWNTAVEEYGERLKAEGVAQVADNNEAWMEQALDSIAVLAVTHAAFTTEHLRNMRLPPPKSPNAWGAAFSVAAKQGLIEACGFTVNKLASAHGRIVRQWKGKHGN